jgi:alkylation response protein AidB-like acyl-CoA dehydrogenase
MVPAGTTEWVRRAEAFVAENQPPLGAPPGSRTPQNPVQLADWAAWSQRLHAAGLATIRWPTEWGGGGASADAALAVTAVLAAAAMPLSLADIGVNMVAPAIMSAGTAAQQDRHVPAIRAGTAIWTQLFSEPEAGSDLAALRCAASADGTDWVINGQKVWSTYAHIADWGFLLARTGTRDERHRGITAFLVPMDAAGVTVRPVRELTGHYDFNEVFFDDVRLGHDYVLGAVGGGWQVAMNLLIDERVVTGRNIIGLQAELDRLTSLAGNTLDPVTANRLGELCADAIAIAAVGELEPAPAGSDNLAKIAFSELNGEVHQTAVDVVAADRYDVPAGWAARWQDSYLYYRGWTISGGANEVLRNVIAKRVLGLPSA